MDCMVSKIVQTCFFGGSSVQISICGQCICQFHFLCDVLPRLNSPTAKWFVNVRMQCNWLSAIDSNIEYGAPGEAGGAGLVSMIVVNVHLDLAEP